MPTGTRGPRRGLPFFSSERSALHSLLPALTPTCVHPAGWRRRIHVTDTPQQQQPLPAVPALPIHRRPGGQGTVCRLAKGTTRPSPPQPAHGRDRQGRFRTKCRAWWAPPGPFLNPVCAHGGRRKLHRALHSRARGQGRRCLCRTASNSPSRGWVSGLAYSRSRLPSDDEGPWPQPGTGAPESRSQLLPASPVPPPMGGSLP